SHGLTFGKLNYLLSFRRQKLSQLITFQKNMELEAYLTSVSFYRTLFKARSLRPVPREESRGNG
ncbi:MAG TPA: hypothetical protein PL112_22045, partial [Candidatus Obscuribacter sp.]|nr:hypothetical protein [Candidatus Obscuribacter sp.]